MRTRTLRAFLASACAFTALAGSVAAQGVQMLDARVLVEQSAQAMGGLDRLTSLDTLTMTGFGQYLNQQGGGNPSPDPRAPSKWQAANAVERTYDLDSGQSLTSDRRGYLFPFAIERGHSWALDERVQSGVDVLDHPLPVLLAALDSETQFGPVTVDDNRLVVEFTLESGRTLWLGIDAVSRLPAWVRVIGPSATLGDVATTTHFSGYLPFDGIRLPVGFSSSIDWRNTTTSYFHVDSYRIDQDAPPRLQSESGSPRVNAPEPRAAATPIARGVWDVRIGGNGGAVIEFDDHLVMFEAYGNEQATFARIDLANTLVPGKAVTELIVSHHHFDHSGGLRAAVSRGLTVISRRGNEQIFREMVARPAPNFPDALALSPKPLRFIPVDEHYAMEDSSMRVDIYHAVGHLHMAEGVFAYLPEHRIFLEGDFTTFNWDWNWWGGAYQDNVERYGLDPAINIPVHGIVTTYDEAIAAIREQVQRARRFCADNESAGIFMAGCPVRYSRD
jgi:hypothetical protein